MQESTKLFLLCAFLVLSSVLCLQPQLRLAPNLLRYSNNGSCHKSILITKQQQERRLQSSQKNDIDNSSSSNADEDDDENRIIAKRIIVTGKAVNGGYYRSCVLNEVRSIDFDFCSMEQCER